MGALRTVGKGSTGHKFQEEEWRTGKQWGGGGGQRNWHKVYWSKSCKAFRPRWSCFANSTSQGITRHTSHYIGWQYLFSAVEYLITLITHHTIKANPLITSLYLQRHTHLQNNDKFNRMADRSSWFHFYLLATCWCIYQGKQTIEHVSTEMKELPDVILVPCSRFWTWVPDAPPMWPSPVPSPPLACHLQEPPIVPAGTWGNWLKIPIRQINTSVILRFCAVHRGKTCEKKYEKSGQWDKKLNKRKKKNKLDDKNVAKHLQYLQHATFWPCRRWYVTLAITFPIWNYWLPSTARTLFPFYFLLF